MRELVKYKEKFIDKIRGLFNKIFGKNTKVEKLSKEKNNCSIAEDKDVFLNKIKMSPSDINNIDIETASIDELKKALNYYDSMYFEIENKLKEIKNKLNI